MADGFVVVDVDVLRAKLREQSLFDNRVTSIDGPQRGNVAARNPLLMTGIVLAGANLDPVKDSLGLPTGEDGILTAEEIGGLNLKNTDLVTLSACETNLGDIAAGEGVMGLSRALHKAGARTVIASLWKVSDNATQTLMTEFYSNLWDDRLRKLQALRQAQLNMIHRYAPKTAQLRGEVRPLKTLASTTDTTAPKPATPAPADTPQLLTPFFWAPFQISGDWR